jgi:hypothetical protein
MGAWPDQDVAAQQPGSQSLGALVPIGYPNPPAIGVDSRTAVEPRSSENPHVCRQFFVPAWPKGLLAMQKVEGSNPFSRSRKGLHLQVFFVVAVE